MARRRSSSKSRYHKKVMRGRENLLTMRIQEEAARHPCVVRRMEPSDFAKQS